MVVVLLPATAFGHKKDINQRSKIHQVFLPYRKAIWEYPLWQWGYLLSKFPSLKILCMTSIEESSLLR